MVPKKNRKRVDVIIGIVLFLVALYVSYAVGAALYDSSLTENPDEKVSGATQLGRTFELFEHRLVNPLQDFREVIQFKKTKQAIAVGAFVWLLVVLNYTTNRKNTIHGKEFGTAQWGERSDISDLFSENLMREEIKKAKSLCTPWGRWREWRKTKKDCRELVKSFKRADLEALEQKAKAEKKARTFDRADYERERKRIVAEAKSRYKTVYVSAWKPAKIRNEYRQEVRNIKKEYEQGITVSNEAEKNAAMREAKRDKRTALREFWSVSKRIEKIREKYKNSDIILTNTERICLYNWKVNGHVLCIGGSGAGKTRGFVMPNILETAGTTSFCITDPKGEILAKSMYFLAKIKGYKIRVLNLDDKSNSDGYNPFRYIHPERDGYEERVLTLIETIIMNTDGGEKKSGGDPFWEKAEFLFLQAIFFFVCDVYTEEEQNMSTALDLIAMLDIAEEEDNFDSDLDLFVEMVEQDLNEADEVNHTAGTKNLGVKMFREFRSKASGKTAKSIVISAVARLGRFHTPQIQRIMSYDTMELDRLGEELMAIFVVVPPTEDTFNCLAGCLFSQIFQEIQYCAAIKHKNDGQRLPIPVRFLLDEFRNTCNIPRFLKILSYARSFGCSIVPIMQSLDQLKVMFKDEWGSIIDNCSSTLFLGSVNNPDALEFFSKMLGKGTFDKRSTSHSKGRQGSFTQSYDVVGRELLTPDEIRKLDKEKCLLLVAGRAPFYSDKYEYTRHPNYRFTSDASKSNTMEYLPQPAPWEAASSSEQEDTHSAHGAQAEPMERVKQRIAKINETANYIELTTDAKKVLEYITENFEYLSATEDTLLEVNDGEASEAGIELFTEDETLDAVVTASYKERLAEIVERAEAKAEAEKIEMASPEETVNVIAETAENLQPVEDKLLVVPDGEPEPDEDIIFDDDFTTDIQEIGDLSSDIDNLLSSIENN